MAIINEVKKYQELEKRIRMMNSQTSDTEKINLIEEDKTQALMRLLNTMKLLMKV